MPGTGIHWFRHGLRLHDNPALFACTEEAERFIPIFIFDGKVAGTEICGYVRWRFLLDSLKDLERQFAKYGIHFMCFYGEPHEVIEKLIKEWDVRTLSFEKDPEAHWRQRDDQVKQVCSKHNVQVIESSSHTLYDPDEIFNMNNDEPPNTCEELRRFCYRLGPPHKPVSSPDFEFFASNLTPTDDIYDAKLHSVPDCERFGVKPDCKEQEVRLFEGGETRALQLFRKRVEYEKESFRNGNVNPNLDKPVLFTKEISLSPYFRFGCLSVRKFYWALKKVFNKHFNGEKNEAENCPTEQIFWREYFYQLSYKNEKFAQIDGNKMCYQIPWDYAGKQELFTKWESGRTGFPWIDACQRQIRQEGWAHHVCRNSLAIFLTRGDLYMSWELGLKNFFYYLVDADWSVCAGNWSWISCGDPEEVLNPTISFCPVKHGKKMDPDGAYIRKYVPELKDYPLEYLFEPWQAPLAVQEEAGCIIGKDYPEPCVDHEEVFRENIDKLRQYFDSEGSQTSSIYDEFVHSKSALKSVNFEEYRAYTHAKFLEFDPEQSRLQ